MILISAALDMSAKLENSAVATGLEKVSLVFILIPQKGNAKECSNYQTMALISHASKVMLKIHQNGLQQDMNQEIPDVQAGFQRDRGIRDQIANILVSWRKQGNSRKTSTSASLTMQKPLTMDHNKLWKSLKRDGSSRPPYLSPDKPVYRTRSKG